MNFKQKAMGKKFLEILPSQSNNIVVKHMSCNMQNGFLYIFNPKKAGSLQSMKIYVLQ